jgi:hypothetical protein
MIKIDTIAKLATSCIKEINVFLSVNSNLSFSEEEISQMESKSWPSCIFRGSLLPDELLLEHGLIEKDFSKKAIADEMEIFKKTLVENDYSPDTYKSLINNELCRIKSQTCRYALVLLSDNLNPTLLLLCDEYLPISVKKIQTT